MSERSFECLRVALLKAGLSRRHARRAVAELDSHFRHSVDDSLARGASLAQARASAHAAIGPDDVLIQHFASRPELRSWSCRAPLLFFCVAPLLGLAAAQVGLLLLVVAAMDAVSPHLRTVVVAPQTAAVASVAARTVMLWVIPGLVASAFGRVAHRHGLPLRWPLLAIGVVCTLAGLTNFDFDITGGVPAALMRMGVGISPSGLVDALLHGGPIAALVIVPLLVGRRMSPGPEASN